MAKSRDFPFNKDPFDILSGLLKPTVEPETGWIRVGVSDSSAEDFYFSPSFENGWDNSSTDGAAPLAFYLSKDGEVRVRGVLDPAGASDVIVFILPEGYRPEYSEKFGMIMEDLTSAIMQIDPDGTVSVTVLS